MAKVSSSNQAWLEAFDKYRVIEEVDKNGYIDLTADQLRVFREPRLMAKIDHSENLPTAFKDSGLTILTLNNSTYRLGPYDIFQPLPEWKTPTTDVKVLPFPSELQTLDFQNLTGEPGIINTANATDMLHDLTGEEVLLTVAGRMRTGVFDFTVDTKNSQQQLIPVAKAQMEIDAGYEGAEKFYIFEVKNHASTNFNFRQLYYPFRTWHQKINKPIVPVFLTLSNDVFDFYEFGFGDINDWSSAELTKHTRYMLTHTHPSKKDLVGEAKRGQSEQERNRANLEGIPFPQADSFERVIDLVSILIENPKSVEDLATHYGFDPRQSDYYYNAAQYLGLATSEEDPETKTQFRTATKKAIDIFAKPYKEKYEALAGEILRIETMSKIYLSWLNSGAKPDGDYVFRTFKDSSDSDKASGEKLSDSTIDRRKQTILSWVTWLVGITDKE